MADNTDAICEHEDKIFNLVSEEFNQRAIDIFRVQAEQNIVYKEYVQALGVNPAGIRLVTDIPFLPIGFFKTRKVATTNFTAEKIFESSGTTGMVSSKHHVRKLGLYEESFLKGFELFYGPVRDWCIIGLLPSYLERDNSSLVVMVDRLIKESEVQDYSGFYLDNYSKLYEVLHELEQAKQKTLLIGVTFALLDFAGRYPMNLTSTIVMETGGMKGRRRELTRDEVHNELRRGFKTNDIHAEYGMTELLSQAYSQGKGIFKCPPWMKVFIRKEDDPFEVIGSHQVSEEGDTGLINVVDLANLYSSSFIATDDIGKLYPDGSFEVLGRMDNSDVRGCSLMVAQ